MNKFTQEIGNWPLWSQLLLLVVLGLVIHFWFGRLSSSLLATRTAGGSLERWWRLIQCVLWSAGLSWIAVRFCVGTNGQGRPYEWGFYGRVLFVGLTAYLSNFLTRYFS